MQVTERPDLASGLLDRMVHNTDYVSAGTAVASIKELTFCLRIPWYDRHAPIKQDVTDSWDDQVRLKVVLGTAFGRLANPHERRVEFETERGFVSGRVDMDGVDDLGDGLYVPEEIKLTWAWQKKDSTSDPWTEQYLEQLKGYCIATGSTKGRLYIVFGREPKLRCFEFEFSTEELEEMAETLEKRTLEVLDDERPDGPRFTWECRGCRYYEKNGGTCDGRPK